MFFMSIGASGMFTRPWTFVYTPQFQTSRNKADCSADKITYKLFFNLLFSIPESLN